MYAILAVINSIPNMIHDPTSLKPLKPKNLIMMKTNIVLPPPGEFQRDDMYSEGFFICLQMIYNKEFENVISISQCRRLWSITFLVYNVYIKLVIMSCL